MKTVTLKIDEHIYPSLLDFLRGLPDNRYAILEDDDQLTAAERQEIDQIRGRLAAPDDSDFEDWADVRANL
jgi:hypothetical protein